SVVLVGISVHMSVGQLPQIGEIPTPHGHLLRDLAMVLWQLPHANLISIRIGFSLYLLTAMVGRRNPRLPAALFGLLLIMLLNAVFNLPKYGVTVLSAVDTQRPDFAFSSLP
ncbi:hypothetical protein J2R62_19370, partial [Plesiomonas shigelloides]|nr:hypothetical protein [Plesiomonas shigelloides]